MILEVRRVVAACKEADSLLGIDLLYFLTWT